jgi:DNA polymerase-4
MSPTSRARWILHADLDAFYASVEQMDNPELRGKPVVVGGSPETRGVVAAASYEARAFGVGSAMPMVRALRLCPQAIRVRPRFGRYQEVSGQIMDIFRELTSLVEPLSLDEAYLDVSHHVASGATIRGLARYLKDRVKAEVGLNVTVGGGTSKSVAKIASQRGKPDGLLIVAQGAEASFLADLDVEMMWGIGPKSAQFLRSQGLETIGQLARQPQEWFREAFGKRGPDLRQRALGQDESPVVPEREAKSVSNETTFVQDISSPEELRSELRRLVERVAGRLERHGFRGKTVTVKMRLSDFTTFTRQTTLPAPTDDAEAIFETAWRLMEPELRHQRSFRLIGAGVSGFAEPVRPGQETQIPMFDQREL